jgi:hypothetical protein
VRRLTDNGKSRVHATRGCGGSFAGPQSELIERQKREAIRGRDIDSEPVREIARSYNVIHSTISRLTA